MGRFKGSLKTTLANGNRGGFHVSGLLSLVLFSLEIISVLQLPAGSKLVTISSAAYSTSLPSYKIIQYQLPNGSSQPWGITVDRTGIVWFVEEQSNQIGMFNPVTKSFNEFNVTTPNSLLEEIAADNSGNVWFTELNGGKLGELKASPDAIREFPIPGGPGSLPCGPIGVTPHSSTVWITCEFSNQIDEFFPDNSTFLSFNLPVFYSAPLDIVFDSSGNFWFSAADSDMIGYVTVSALKAGTSNGINEFAPTNPTYLTTLTNPQAPPGVLASNNTTIVSSLLTPSQIAISPDGTTLWITEHVSSSFDSYNIKSKSLQKYWTSQTNNPEYLNALPNGIGFDNSGIIWIAEHYGNKIAEFDPSTNAMIEYPIPCCGSQLAGSLYLAPGRNSTVWFTEFFGNKIGELVRTDSNISLSISASNETLSLSGNGASDSTKIMISSNSYNRLQNVSLEISGVSSTGVVPNATIGFVPSQVSVPANGTAVSVLSFKTEGLAPGIYYLTVSGTSSITGEIYSSILALNIRDSTDYHTLISAALLTGVILSVVTVFALAVIIRRPKVRRG